MCVQSRNIEIEATTLCSFLAVQTLYWIRPRLF